MSLYHWAVHPRRRKHKLFTIGSKLKPFKPKLDFFYQNSQPLHDFMQKKTENLECVQYENFDFTDSLKNNVPKCLLVFYNSWEVICNSKAFVDIALAGRHRGLITFYIEQNIFQPSKLRREAELQSTQIVLFNSPCDVRQVSTLSPQLALGSDRV